MVRVKQAYVPGPQCANAQTIARTQEGLEPCSGDTGSAFGGGGDDRRQNFPLAFKVLVLTIRYRPSFLSVFPLRPKYLPVCSLRASSPQCPEHVLPVEATLHCFSDLGLSPHRPDPGQLQTGFLGCGAGVWESAFLTRAAGPRAPRGGARGTGG